MFQLFASVALSAAHCYRPEGLGCHRDCSLHLPGDQEVQPPAEDRRGETAACVSSVVETCKDYTAKQLLVYHIMYSSVGLGKIGSLMTPAVALPTDFYVMLHRLLTIHLTNVLGS